jgi:predicted nucleic acid-binding protein
LLDIFTDDPVFYAWSRERLTFFSQMAKLYINPIIYSEISINYTSIERFEAILEILPLVFLEIPKAALFLAGEAFANYRRTGGNKISPLPDFYIGAHAAVNQWSVITSDPSRISHPLRFALRFAESDFQSPLRALMGRVPRIFPGDVTPYTVGLMT